MTRREAYLSGRKAGYDGIAAWAAAQIVRAYEAISHEHAEACRAGIAAGVKARLAATAKASA